MRYYASMRGFFSLRNISRHFFLLGSLWLGNSLQLQAEEALLSRIAFGSCLDQDRPAPILAAINRARPELFIMLGDNVYANKGGILNLRPAYKKLFAQQEFIKLKSGTKLIAVWDDNDYGLRDSGLENQEKELAKKVFLEYFGDGKSDQRHKHPGIYASYYFGPEEKRLQVIVLDTRTFRTALKEKPLGSYNPNSGPYLANQDPQATILGKAQWEWLEAELERPARFRIIASSIQVISENHGFEKWGNFPLERKRLLNLLEDIKLGPLLVISGDRHFSSLVKYEGSQASPVYEATSSSLNLMRGYGDGANPYLAAQEVYDANFAALQIDWGKSPLNAYLEFINDEGRVVSEKLLEF